MTFTHSVVHAPTLGPICVPHRNCQRKRPKYLLRWFMYLGHVNRSRSQEEKRSFSAWIRREHAVGVPDYTEWHQHHISDIYQWRPHTLVSCATQACMATTPNTRHAYYYSQWHTAGSSVFMVNQKTKPFNYYDYVLPIVPCDASAVLATALSEFYQNSWTNLAGFWHGSFLPPIICRVLKEFRYLQNKGTPL